MVAVKGVPGSPPWAITGDRPIIPALGPQGRGGVEGGYFVHRIPHLSTMWTNVYQLWTDVSPQKSTQVVF